MLYKSLTGLALLGVSTAAIAAAPLGKLKPGAAEAEYLANVFDTQANVIVQGTDFGKHLAKMKKASAFVSSRKKPSALVISKTRAGPTVLATAYSNLSYDYIFHAKNQTAFDQLSDYAATHDGTIAVIKGLSKLAVKGVGSALTSVDGGAAITASFACTETGGDCNGIPHQKPYFSFAIPGSVVISDAGKLDFAGHILLTSFASSYSPKAVAFALIDPEVGLPDDFGGLANDFTIELSDDIVNAIALDSVPEPASWALLVIGFGLAGAAMRKRRASSAG